MEAAETESVDSASRAAAARQNGTRGVWQGSGRRGGRNTKGDLVMRSRLESAEGSNPRGDAETPAQLSIIFPRPAGHKTSRGALCGSVVAMSPGDISLDRVGIPLYS